MRVLARATAVVGGLAGVALIGGFVWFAANAADVKAPDDPHAEGIVVLTGGTARIDSALRLLAEGRAERLLISGVNPVVTGAALVDTYGTEFDAVLACCVDLGRDAQDTIGNAAETRAWVGEQHFASLLVVTSDYHIARSMAELADALPGVELTPVPIVTPGIDLSDWWHDPTVFALLSREYGKYLVTVARLAVQPPPSPVATSTAASSP